MNILEGLELKENVQVSWTSKIEEFRNTCENNKINYIEKTTDKIVSISLPIEFANIGKVQATVYFMNKNKYISEIYLSSSDSNEFNLQNYLNIDEKLILYFGVPKIRKKNKTLWDFTKIRIKHFFIHKDDTTIEYLLLENKFAL